MSDPHLEAIERDLSFLAKVVQLQGTGHLTKREIARFLALADRYPRGGTHDGDRDSDGDDGPGATR